MLHLLNVKTDMNMRNHAIGTCLTITAVMVFHHYSEITLTSHILFVS